MIAYNKVWLANLRLQNQAERDMKGGYISETELKAIAERYPVGFYTPNLIIRIGLFLLTCIIVLFADGLLSLIAESVAVSYGWILLLGVLSYIGLELMVNKNHFRSGVDDALIFVMICQFIGGFAIMLNSGADTHFTAFSFLVFLLALILTIRFANMLAAIVCCVSFFAFVFYGWTGLIPGGLSTAPFIIMLVSGGIYFAAFRNAGNIRFVNYGNCLTVVQLVSLVFLYAAGNYYVIQTLSTELAGKTGPVAFGMIFWIWTTLLPFVYVLLGIKRKGVILLRTGLILIAVAIVTFKYYHHIIPVDLALTIGGAVLLTIVYATVRYLKTPKHGFTYAEPDDLNLLDSLKVESLIVAESFSHVPTAPAQKETRFGGGDFGGGGSSGDF